MKNTSTTLHAPVARITEALLAAIDNDRARLIVSRRYAIGGSKKPETLDAIGHELNITRERVRQIEAHALKSIQKSSAYKTLAPFTKELTNIFEQLGGIIGEAELLDILAKNDTDRAHLLFLLHVAEPFQVFKENPESAHHWYLDDAHAREVREAIRALYAHVDKHTLLPEEEIVRIYREKLGSVSKKHDRPEVLSRWIGLSKKLNKNPLGEWGLADAPNVRVKSMRDYAYLTLRRHGSPMHFAEVAKQITDLFGRTAHRATTHNELIKDPRFVLVGRGLYALSEWGYKEGVVKDVLRAILADGPLSREEILDRVKRERYVKDNTILVNLHDTTLFSRTDDGRFALATAQELPSME